MFLLACKLHEAKVNILAITPNATIIMVKVKLNCSNSIDLTKESKTFLYLKPFKNGTPLIMLQASYSRAF